MDADKNHSGECARTAEREETLSWAAARRHSIMVGGGHLLPAFRATLSIPARIFRDMRP